jgi:hypothetical protein
MKIIYCSASRVLKDAYFTVQPLRLNFSFNGTILEPFVTFFSVNPQYNEQGILKSLDISILKCVRYCSDSRSIQKN